MNIKRLVGILAFLGLSSLACAQTIVASGGIVTNKLTGDSITGSTVTGSEIRTPISLNSSYDPAYTGNYLVTLSVDVSASNWTGLKGTKVSGYYFDLPSKDDLFFDEKATGVDGIYTFTTTLASSVLSKDDRIGYHYSDMTLAQNQWIQFSANYTITAVPEPSTYALLLGVGTLGLVGWRRFRRK